MRLVVLAICAAGTFALSACGSTSHPAGGGASSASAQSKTQGQTPPSANAAASSTVSLSADPTGKLKFSTSQAAAKAGKVMLRFTNPSPVPHGASIEGGGLDKEGAVIQRGGSSVLTLDLKPGSYTYYCPVPGHRQAGMQGTLVVQ